MIPIILLVLFSLLSNAQINWQGDWAFNCDWLNHDLTNAKTTGDQCGPICEKTHDCTHFTWTPYLGGTCWMKSGTVFKSDARPTPTQDNSIVCGLLSSSDPTPPPPPPPPGPPSPLTEKLRIVNQATKKIWIFYQSRVLLPFANPTGIEAGQYHDFHFDADKYYPSLRFWPGWGCNSDGTNCQIGASGGVFPGGDPSGGADTGKFCPVGGCAPPVDSKFEATFQPPKPDFINLSQVDGYTLPYKLTPHTPDGSLCAGATSPSVDCSQLDLSKCPSENFPGYGVKDPKVYNPKTNKLSGCFSPCSSLTMAQWNYGRVLPTDPKAQWYCCTPPITSDQCSHGPVISTNYVKYIHDNCPIYSYAYQDAIGLNACKSGTKYELTFYDPRGIQFENTEQVVDIDHNNEVTPNFTSVVIPTVVVGTVALIAIVAGIVVVVKKNKQVVVEEEPNFQML
eukprot:TRINITY_DN12802_c0_g1_i2.p1 TRINITY_DN12802_c0_g1~~TRINITY_DN12802_c0_g1_i2.p1  ORF type:complete len:451 (+),score=101.42 TRINITY_DN12802_c0_g1_i2:3-1355(+)